MESEDLASQTDNRKTVDLGEVYDKMNVQTGYEHHSKFWKEQVKAEEERLEKIFRLEDEAKEAAKSSKLE
jgi:hypothetical protein